MEKILQIIPAPVDAYTEYPDGIRYPVVCLALIGPRRKARVVPIVVITSVFSGMTTTGFDEKGALHIGSNFGELPL